MSGLFDQIGIAAAAIADRWPHRPRLAVVLGTGLGPLAERIEAAVRIPFAEIPHFGRATALGHKGQLVCGTLAGVPTIALQGRLHGYEGHSAAAIGLPTYVLARLGAEVLVVSNAAGGLNPLFAVGDVMLLNDHINLLFRNPLVGTHDPRLGDHFPDMSAPYDHALIQIAVRAARAGDFACHRGTYAAVLGPNYETRAEMRMLRHLGADAVGMSTVPEVLVAVRCGLRVLGISTITNLCNPDRTAGAEGHAVEAAGKQAAPRLEAIVKAVALELRREERTQ